MCGIAGVVGECTPSLLMAMAKKIAHRGPDNLSTISFDDVHLAHVRLSIIDLSPNSNQPIWDINKQICIVFNGEIYNYRELRQVLLNLGYMFSSEGDAEVILNLYLEHGPECLKQLNGIFAFSIWDTRNKELFIARDPFGVKPLYYTQNDHGFYFSSEMKSLLVNPSVSRELNEVALLRSVIFLWSPGPDTILKNIFKLKPGNYLIVKNRKIVEQVEYYPLPYYKPEKMSTEVACNEAESVLKDSIEDQLVADVPVGAFLSGGLDSSLIVAMAKNAGAGALDCFTIESMQDGANNDGFVDDLPYAKKVAEFLGVNLDVVKVNPDILKLLPKMIYHLDEPQADPAPLNVLLICEEARKKGIKVLFSGAGGDDLFSGYRRHWAINLEVYWSWFPLSVRRLMQKMSHQLPKKNSKLRRMAKMFAYAAAPENERLLSYFYWIDPSIARGLFIDEIQNRLTSQPNQLILEELDNLSECNPLEKMLYLERRYFLVDHNFNYTDKMSMAHGVEVRVPFLDKGVIEFAARLNTGLKQKGNEGKWILKKMAERYLPKSVIYRSKSGFGAPLRHWLKHDLKFLVDDLLGEESLVRRNIFKPEAIYSLIKQDREGQQDYSYPIFALLCIELWCRIFIDCDANYEDYSTKFYHDAS